MDKLKPELSLAGEKAFGPSSPVQQALNLIRTFLSLEPTPDINTLASKSSGLLVGNHVLHLISACGLLNGSGLHSAAITLLRPLEDALDCFAAVTMANGAAEQWSTQRLKPSEAAKLWINVTGDMISPDDTTLDAYRKTLRGQFAHYMHCSYDLCLWDLYFNPLAHNHKTGQLSGTYELNKYGHVINTNAHAIDAHLIAHHLEFITILKHAYSVELGRDSTRYSEFIRLETEIVKIMERHNEHKCQNVLVPPEMRKANP